MIALKQLESCIWIITNYKKILFINLKSVLEKNSKSDFLKNNLQNLNYK